MKNLFLRIYTVLFVIAGIYYIIDTIKPISGIDSIWATLSLLVIVFGALLAIATKNEDSFLVSRISIISTVICFICYIAFYFLVKSDSLDAAKIFNGAYQMFLAIVFLMANISLIMGLQDQSAITRVLKTIGFFSAALAFIFALFIFFSGGEALGALLFGITPWYYKAFLGSLGIDILATVGATLFNNSNEIGAGGYISYEEPSSIPNNIPNQGVASAPASAPVNSSFGYAPGSAGVYNAGGQVQPQTPPQNNNIDTL